MIYVIMRKEISKYLVTKVSCDHLFSKIKKLDDPDITLDFMLVYYISYEFMDAYIKNKNNCTKNILEKNLPLTFKKLIENNIK